MPLVYRQADLDKYPSLLSSEARHVSVGDLHGNALKLIYILVEEGILELDAERYNQLRDVYNTPVNQLTREQLELFQNNITQATVNPKKALTLIGDELADRGNNDYFTLLVLQKLHDAKVNLDTLLSNHSVEFIRDYAAKSFTGFYNLGRGQGQSLTNMRVLISKGLISEDVVRQIVKQSYQPLLKGISYTVSEQGQLTLFTHAPVGLETVEGIAKKWHIPYKDRTTKELIQTIDAINKQIKDSFAEKNLADIIDNEEYSDPDYPVSPSSSPLKRLVWNRAVGEELRTKTSTGIEVHFVHGHIGDDPLLKNGQSLSTHENLDSSWGKSRRLFKTGFNEVFQMDVKHFTRHSSDLTALELTPQQLSQLSAQEAKIRYDELVTTLKVKLDELIKKGTMGHPEYDTHYEKAAAAATVLSDELNDAKQVLFSESITNERLDKFTQMLTKSVTKANDELSHHRGLWFSDNPLLQFVKGVVGVILALCVVPVFVVNSTIKSGFVSVFFQKPPTDSSEKLQQFERDLSSLVNCLQPEPSLDGASDYHHVSNQ